MDLQQIQSHGASRGVQVYLEIDMPGHTSSLHYTHPDVITAFNQQPGWADYSAEPPSGQLRLNCTPTYDFLDTLWDDLLPRLKPYTNHMHTGGDEVNFLAYALDPTVRSNASSVIRPLLQRFIDRQHAKIRAAGLTPIVWEEMLLEYNITFPSDVLVQTWKSPENVRKTVQKGHKAIAGNYDFWYLDCGHGGWVSYSDTDAKGRFSGQESQAAQGWPYEDYCSPRKNWRTVYSYNPLQGVAEEDQHLVVGGEASMWSEQTDAVNLDQMLWPRLSAVAEVLWRGQPGGGRNLSQVEATPRLAEMRERLVAMGVNAEPVVMPFCTMYNGSCVMGDDTSTMS